MPFLGSALQPQQQEDLLQRQQQDLQQLRQALPHLLAQHGQHPQHALQPSHVQQLYSQQLALQEQQQQSLGAHHAHQLAQLQSLLTTQQERLLVHLAGDGNGQYAPASPAAAAEKAASSTAAAAAPWLATGLPRQFAAPVLNHTSMSGAAASGQQHTAGGLDLHTLIMMPRAEFAECAARAAAAAASPATSPATSPAAAPRQSLSLSADAHTLERAASPQGARVCATAPHTLQHLTTAAQAPAPWQAQVAAAAPAAV